MKNFIKKHCFIFIQLVISLIFLIILIILSLIKLSVNASEWYTRNIYNLYLNIFSPINRFIPFSITEIVFILFILSIVSLIVACVVLLIKKRKEQALQIILFIPLLSLFALDLYQGTAGISYSRKSLPISLYENDVAKDDALKIVKYFVDDFNYVSSLLTYDESGEVICPYSYEELNDILLDEYCKIESSYLIGSNYNTKKMLFPTLYSEFHITGMFFSITTESIINYYIPNSDLPFTMLHELSHSRGILREDDAQLMAAFISLSSDIPFVKYSGYMNTIYSMLNLARLIDEEEGIKINNSLREEIFLDSQYSSNFWNKYHTLNDIATFFNDLYLKLFSNDDTSSYIDEPPVVNPDGKISYSTYQKLYFAFYFETISFS